MSVLVPLYGLDVGPREAASAVDVDNMMLRYHVYIQIEANLLNACIYPSTYLFNLFRSIQYRLIALISSDSNPKQTSIQS